MDINRLHIILAETCAQYRKGPEVEKRQAGPVEVTEVYFMPPVPEDPPGAVLVDMQFLVIGVDTAKAAARKDELVAILNDWPNDELAVGSSYIAVGGTIGDQGAAFCLFALGKVLGLWNVITPASFGMTGEEARRAAGSGWIMITGYRPQKKDAA